MSESLPIVTGDPEEGPASYSRFLLPFSYRKERRREPSEGAARFVPASEPSSYRRQYLTFETANVLYDRARWLELQASEGEASLRLTLFRPLGPREERAILVEIAAPRLVLFEWRPKPPKDENEEDPFATGFLLLDLWFPEPGVTLDDLCFLNESFRYWMQPFAEHPERKGYHQALRQAPRSLGRWLGGKSAESESLDPYLDRWAWLLDVPCQVGDERFLVVPCEAQRDARDWMREGKSKSGWIVYSDARAYVWTCAVIDHGAGHLAQGRPWTCLLNVDPPGGGALSAFEQKWTRERTYERWVESGSIYGFTVHSGAAMVPPWEEPPLWRHFRESYFDQTLLLLYTRVALFRFSRWLSEVSARGRDSGAGLIDRELERGLSRIRKGLTLFANLYQFPLLSNQQQGIEMYVLARQVMDIRELAEELHTQVDGSHELLDMLADQEEARAARRLSLVAAVGLPFALATGFLGMNMIAEDLAQGRWPQALEWTVAALSLAFAALLVFVTYRGRDFWRSARKRFSPRKEKRAP